jgi:hypothetical protein
MLTRPRFHVTGNFARFACVGRKNGGKGSAPGSQGRGSPCGSPDRAAPGASTRRPCRRRKLPPTSKRLQLRQFREPKLSGQVLDENHSRRIGACERHPRMLGRGRGRVGIRTSDGFCWKAHRTCRVSRIFRRLRAPRTTPRPSPLRSAPALHAREVIGPCTVCCSVNGGGHQQGGDGQIALITTPCSGTRGRSCLHSRHY